MFFSLNSNILPPTRGRGRTSAAALQALLSSCKGAFQEGRDRQREDVGDSKVEVYTSSATSADHEILVV